jgi:hypothetical protein
VTTSTVSRKLAQPLFCLVLVALAGLHMPGHADPSRRGTPFASAEEDEAAAWKLTLQRDDFGSYETFLARYPDSRFKSQAEAALQRFRKQEAAFTAHPYNSFARPEKLAALAVLEGGTGLPGLPFGTRLLGPGVMVVGPLMERRHVLLPFGEWVPMAALNHQLSSATALRMTSVALGKFSGHNLEELMLVTFNREAPSTQFQSAGITAVPSWPALEQCNAAKDQSDYHLKDSDMRSRWCSTIVSKGVALDTLQPPALLSRAKAALSALDVKLPDFGHQSETHVTLQSGHFISYTHLYRAAPTRVLLVPVMEEGDVALSPQLDPATRWAYFQQAHFAYHAAVAFGQYYKQLALQPATRLSGQAVVQTLGRSP